MGATPPRDIGLRQHGELRRREDEPAFQRLDDDPHPGRGEVGRSVVHDRRGQALLAQDRGDAPGAPLAFGADGDRVPLTDQATELLGQPRRVGHHRVPPGGRDPRRARCLGRRGDRQHRRLGVCEQPLERQVQPGEGGGLLRPALRRAPGLGQRGGQGDLLVDQLASPVAHPAGVDEHDLSRRSDQVAQEVLLARQPRKPRLHAVEHEALGEPLPLGPAPGLLAHEEAGPLLDGGSGEKLTAGEDLDPLEVLGRPLVVHVEGGEAVDLVTPQVDADGAVGRRGEHVHDAAADRHLAPVLDLVFTPVPGEGQPLDQLVGVDDVAGRDHDGLGVLDPRSQSLDEGPHGCHDQSRPPFCPVAQPPHGPQPPAHGLDAGADPFERKRLPCRKDLDRVRSRVGPEVEGEPLGVGAGGHRNQQRLALAQLRQSRQREGPGGLRHGNHGTRRTQHVDDGVVVAQQARKGAEPHRFRLPATCATAGGGEVSARGRPHRLRPHGLIATSSCPASRHDRSGRVGTAFPGHERDQKARAGCELVNLSRRRAPRPARPGRAAPTPVTRPRGGC